MSFIMPSAEVEHSVEVRVPRRVAWDVWSDPSNWTPDSAIESVEIDGPFALGTLGTTKSKDQETQWTITSVDAEKSAVLELDVDGIKSRIVWIFSELSNHGTLMTQKMAFEGPQAEVAAEMFRTTLPEGMARLAKEIEGSVR